MENSSNYNYIFFKKNKFIKITPKRNGHLFDFYKFKGNTDDKLRDFKDAGALKAKKDYLISNYNKYAELLIKNGYLNFIETDLKLKLYPYKLMHVISDENTKHLIWHRDVYKHMGKKVGPSWPLYKLAIYLQKTEKSNGITGFIPGNLNIDFNNKYFDTLYAFLISKFAFYANAKPGEAMLFSGGVMHHRPASPQKNSREAIIFSLTTSYQLFDKYLEDEYSFPNFLRKNKYFTN